MDKFDIKLAKKTIRFLTSNIRHIKKFNIENYTSKCFIYVFTNKCIFNISISDQIVIEIDNNQDRFNSAFYNETYSYTTVDDFKELFNRIVLKVNRKDETGLKVIFNGVKYPVYVEISSIDVDKSMGIQKKYDLNIYDSKGKEHFVAQVSEYPIGNYNIVHIFEGFKISESEIIDHFYNIYQ